MAYLQNKLGGTNIVYYLKQQTFFADVDHPYHFGLWKIDVFRFSDLTDVHSKLL